jgi:hypothetical protein
VSGRGTKDQARWLSPVTVSGKQQGRSIAVQMMMRASCCPQLLPCLRAYERIRINPTAGCNLGAEIPAKTVTSLLVRVMVSVINYQLFKLIINH